MNEEIIISGRNLPYIDPVLNIWHWQIPLYLFVGGLAAALIFFSAYFFIRGRGDELKTSVQIAPILAPFVIVIGLIALLLDLRHPAYFWQLYTTIRLDSPMSWGAWTLAAIMPLSVIWPLTFLKEIKEYFSESGKRVKGLIQWIEDIINAIKPLKLSIEWFTKYRYQLAWVNAILAIILGVYTGILLSAFNARPLWNTSILGPLFLVSGLSTGAAVIMWMSRSKKERLIFSRIDLLLIAIELFFIIHLFMGFLASGAVQIEAAQLFLGGDYTAIFWAGVVMVGLVIPAILETMELYGYHIPISIPALLILIGGLLFRFIMVEAGQITRYLY
ncbi:MULTISPECIES: NrfD/PsrC family molybdoenzyme membrane anchor subunit [unclassified Lentimicrobium]|uniref:NrfD/PsrC family molybdoenzyme membrane anchor subunit n=1 Tax=unclassified Lentimicrobium TaxID=2677434 RepID=UPI001552EBF6|nr:MULTISPECIES: NrfD/PsrC family molybdoenzyme membrane anchor subunit [unclassified Lentimicrobium]NPD45270.1 polysulfide reductase NrfD [Lentimicrobium sp. S6]NPD86220.1 polysulfide reductase NrfD [Lentimicrobium sp. L6]